MYELIARRSVSLEFAKLLCVLGIAAAQLGLATQTNGESRGDIPDKSAQIDALFDSISLTDTPGASVIVIQDGQVLHKEGYGLANIEHGVPNTPHTKFRLGSVTKSFTAAAILMLHEQGLLSIDDKVSRHLPDLHSADRMTIRHLLTHTSGFSESEDEPLLFEPGERINYSNFGYNLLGRILEKVSGKSYEDYVQEHIFRPLGMLNSGYDRHTPILKNRASGYSIGSNGGYVNAEYIDMSGPHAAGALYSTVEDLYLWDQALHTDKLLKASTLEQAFTPAKLSGGREAAYGMGWMLGDRGGLREVGHGGDITGFNSYIARFPDQHFSVMVLSNVGMHPPGPVPNAGALAHQIIQICLGDQMKPEEPLVEVELSEELLGSYVGVYQVNAPEVVTSVAGSTLKITREGNQLFSETKLGKARLRAVSVTELRQDGLPLSLTFIKNSQGRATEILISAGGLREFTATRAE